MKNNKMSKTIGSIVAITDDVLGRATTGVEATKVLEFIESLDAPTQVAVETPVETTVKAPTLTKAKPKSKRKVKYINWLDKQEWLDTILDGQRHYVTYARLNQNIPNCNTIRRSSLRNRFDHEAKRRGFKGASIKFNDTAGHIVIEVK